MPWLRIGGKFGRVLLSTRPGVLPIKGEDPTPEPADTGDAAAKETTSSPNRTGGVKGGVGRPLSNLSARTRSMANLFGNTILVRTCERASSAISAKVGGLNPSPRRSES